MDNDYFKKFCQILNPEYKLPERHKFSKELVPREFARVQIAVEERIQMADFLALSIDGWTDVAMNAIIDVIVYTPEPFLYDSIDTGENSHTGINSLRFF